MTETTYENLSKEYKELLDAAELALKNSYNPYSSSEIKISAFTKLRFLVFLFAVTFDTVTL